MPEKRFLQHGSSAIYIEVPEGTTGSDKNLDARLVGAVQDLAESFGQGLREVSDAARPDSVRVEFGLRIASDGQLLITQGNQSANVVVRFTWGGGATPDIDVPEPS